MAAERRSGLAERLRLRGHLDRTAERLHRAGWLGVSIGRILPGSRVYTSLIAGVTAMPLLTFMLGLLGADLVWLGVLVGLGVAVGIPAADYLHIAMALFLRGVVVVISLLAAPAVLRLVRPPAAGSEAPERPTLARLFAVISPDVVIFAAIAAGASVVLAKAGVLTEVLGVAIVTSVALLIYVVGTRLAFASTAGERLSVARCCPHSSERDPRFQSTMQRETLAYYYDNMGGQLGEDRVWDEPSLTQREPRRAGTRTCTQGLATTSG